MIPTAATTVSASMGGRVTTAARTSTTVPARLVTTVQPVMTAWPLSSASVLMGARVRLHIQLQYILYMPDMILLR